MAVVEKSALVPFPAQAMYDLVADVARYPDFLPWCSWSEVVSDDGQRLCARIEVARLGIRQKFATCNELDPPGRMGIALHEGPFRKLQGEWRFTSLREDACKVALTLEFEFSGRLIDKAFGRVFHQVANTLVESFVQRARDLYG